MPPPTPSQETRPYVRPESRLASYLSVLNDFPSMAPLAPFTSVTQPRSTNVQDGAPANSPTSPSSLPLRDTRQTPPPPPLTPTSTTLSSNEPRTPTFPQQEAPTIHTRLHTPFTTAAQREEWAANEQYPLPEEARRILLPRTPETHNAALAAQQQSPPAPRVLPSRPNQGRLRSRADASGPLVPAQPNPTIQQTATALPTQASQLPTRQHIHSGAGTGTAVFGHGSSPRSFRPLSRVARVSVDASLLGYHESTDEDGDGDSTVSSLYSETESAFERRRAQMHWYFGRGGRRSRAFGREWVEGGDGEEDERGTGEAEGDETAVVGIERLGRNVGRLTSSRQGRAESFDAEEVMDAWPERPDDVASSLLGESQDDDNASETDRRSTIGVIDMVREQLEDDSSLRDDLLAADPNLNAASTDNEAVGPKTLPSEQSLTRNEILRQVEQDGLAPLQKVSHHSNPQTVVPGEASNMLGRLTGLVGPNRRKSSAFPSPSQQRGQSFSSRRQSLSNAKRRFSHRLSSTVDSVAAAAAAAKKAAAAIWTRKDSGYESVGANDDPETEVLRHKGAATRTAGHENSQEIDDLRERGYVGPPLSESWQATRTRIIEREGWDPWPERSEEESLRLGEARMATAGVGTGRERGSWEGRAGRREFTGHLVVGDDPLSEHRCGSSAPRQTMEETRDLEDGESLKEHANDRSMLLEDAVKSADSKGRFQPERLGAEHSQASNNRGNVGGQREGPAGKSNWSSLLQRGKARTEGYQDVSKGAATANEEAAKEATVQAGRTAQAARLSNRGETAKEVTVQAGRAAQAARLPHREPSASRRDWIATLDVVGVAMSGHGPL